MSADRFDGGGAGVRAEDTSGFVAKNLRSPILIFGLPRSGTTWLAKLFDSHPLTLYRHEPDIESREDRLPYACRPEEWPSHRDLARQYVVRLLDTRTVRLPGHHRSSPRAFALPTTIFCVLQSFWRSGPQRMCPVPIRCSNASLSRILSLRKIDRQCSRY